jgi:hypothetical protein
MQALHDQFLREAQFRAFSEVCARVLVIVVSVFLLARLELPLLAFDSLRFSPCEPRNLICARARSFR